jgi:hypothetical protein
MNTTAQIAIFILTGGVVLLQYVYPAVKPYLKLPVRSSSKLPAMQNIELVMQVRDQYVGKDKSVVETANTLLQLLLKATP